MTDPLAGFVLFRNMQETVQVVVGRGYVRITNDALRMIGDPTHINVFFDETGKRMAVKASDEKMQNVFSITKNTGLRRSAALWNRILDIAEMEFHPGEVIKFNGQKCGSDYLIFDLKRPKVTRFDNHVAVMNAKRAKKEEGS